ncbi:hypothetical protein ACEPQK_23950, partial [Escherichia coli]
KNGSVKVTRTDLHRCYSPISFTVIRTRHIDYKNTDPREIIFIKIPGFLFLITEDKVAITFSFLIKTRQQHPA